MKQLHGQQKDVLNNIQCLWAEWTYQGLPGIYWCWLWAEAFIQESPPSLIINVLLVVSRTAPKLMIDLVYQLHPSKGSQSMACTWVVTASNWIVTATTADFYPPPLKIKSVLNKSSTKEINTGKLFYPLWDSLHKQADEIETPVSLSLRGEVKILYKTEQEEEEWWWWWWLGNFNKLLCPFRNCLLKPTLGIMLHNRAQSIGLIRRQAA